MKEKMSKNLNETILKNLSKEIRNGQIYIRKGNIKDENIKNCLGINLNEKNILINGNKIKNETSTIKMSFNKNDCSLEKIKYSKLDNKNDDIVNETKNEIYNKKFNQKYKINLMQNKIEFKYIIFLINYMIMTNLVFFILANIERNQLYESTGYSSIYSSTFNTVLKQITINGIQQSTP